jgi:FtsH-binding integral membrane protein
LEIEDSMSYEPNRSSYADPRTASRYDIDTGLRQHMLRVYNYMAGGLAVTGLVALLAVSTGVYQAIAHTPLMWVVIFAPFAIVLLMGFRIQQMSMGAVQMAFWAFAALMGLSLAGIFLVYTQTSIATTFFITASMFLFMSLYGYTTKRDLSGMGSFMMMGLFGIIIAGLVNMFLHSSGLHLAISVLGVIIFTGLTAWDTQRIKEVYFAGMGPEWAGKSAVMGALTLYLDFINLFMLLLQFMGVRRNN